MLHVVNPDIIVRWHRLRFWRYWAFNIQRRCAGRPPGDSEIRQLIQQLRSANIGWDDPGGHGELLTHCINLYQAIVSKYMKRQHKPSSRTWRTLLTNHAKCFSSIDYFTVPTATCRILYAFIFFSHERRLIVHFNDTEHFTPQWTAHQIMEACPFDTSSHYLLRDRNCTYSHGFRRRVRSMGAEEELTTLQSLLPNPYVESIFGSIR